MQMALKAARFANLFLTGVLTGNEFGSWAVLHPALRELPHQAHVRSFGISQKGHPCSLCL